MTKAKLLVTASTVTAMIAVISFSVASVDAQTPAGFEPTGKQVVYHQANWNGVEDANRLAIDLTLTTATPPNNWRTFWQDYVHSEVTFPGATGLRLVRSTSYRKHQNVQVKAGVVEGRNNGVIATDYYISDGLTASTGDTVLWQAISFAYRAPTRDAMTLSYRVADTLTTDPAATDWQAVTLRFANRNQTAKVKISPTVGQGKFLQFKTNISRPNNFLNTATVVGQPLRNLSTVPTPTPSDNPGPGDGTPTPTPTTTTIITEQLKVVQQAFMPMVPARLTPIIVNEQSAIANDRYCSLADPSGMRSYRWSKSLRSVGVVPAVTRDSEIMGIAGVNGRALRNAYVISNPMTIESTGPITWRRFDIEFDKNLPGTVETYYRLFDDPTGAINKPVDPTWIKLADPATVNPTACESSYLASYQLNQTAKYVQYKFHVISKRIASRLQKQVIRRINLSADATRTVIVTPTPSSSATPSGTPTPVGDGTPTPTPTGSGTASSTGHMTIITKVLRVPSATPTPNATGPALPPSASPTATASSSAPPALSSLCFNQYETEIAPNVGLRVKAKVSGGFDAEDETTNDQGVWRGLNGARDEFPSGRYDVTFGDFEPDELGLVAFCVEPNNDLYYVQTAMNVKNKLAAINILPGVETRLIALYAPKNQPFVKLEKYSLAGNIDKTGAIIKEAIRKKLKTVNPGQTFLYRITYENTASSAVTEADAKDLLIQDVIPEGLELPAVVIENPELYDIEIRFDTAKNQTIVARTIERLKAGESGFIDIPVTVNTSLFPVK